MTSSIINLQNTPDRDGVIAEAVSFPSGDVTLKGIFYKPADREGPFPTAIATGAWTTVKEQMAGTYAREFSRSWLGCPCF